MSNINNIKFRIQSKNKDRASLDPESFVVTWQLSNSLSEVYDRIETAWRNQSSNTLVKNSFYTSQPIGFKQLRGRATKYRKKGVNLKRLAGENSTPYNQRVDYAHLTALANALVKNLSNKQ
jgi:ribonuclease HI